MQFETLIHARTPRVSCPEHGVRVIELPWAKKYSHFTLLFEAFAIEVLKASKSINGLLAWFDSRITNSVTEGYNATIQALKAAARGFLVLLATTFPVLKTTRHL